MIKAWPTVNTLTRFSGVHWMPRPMRHPVCIAVLISLIGHLFLISVISVVQTRGDIAAPKFSKVSFLGPLLSRGFLDLTVEPKAPSFLEQRFFDEMADALTLPYDVVTAEDTEEGSPIEDIPGMDRLITESVGGEKQEPEFGFGREAGLME